jgi:hypothetical protein
MLGRKRNGCRSLSTLQEVERQRMSPEVARDRHPQDWPECGKRYNPHRPRRFALSIDPLLQLLASDRDPEQDTPIDMGTRSNPAAPYLLY